MAFCDRMVHLKCTHGKLNKSFVKIVHESPHLLWTCEDCRKLIRMARFKSVVTSSGDVINAITEKQESAHAEIRSELAKQGQQIAQLSRCISPSISTPTREQSGPARQPPLKRRRDEGSVSTKPLTGGTKIVDNASVLTVPEPVELFWLYLSRIHPSVKPDAIEKLVKDCLQCEETVKAVPLVKRGLDCSRLNFISYKVGIDPKLRDVALSADTWPKGILFREFEDNTSKNLWLPRPNTPTILVSPAPGTSSFSTPICDSVANR